MNEGCNFTHNIFYSEPNAMTNEPKRNANPREMKIIKAWFALQEYTMGKVISKFYNGTSEYFPKLHDLIIAGTRQIFLALPKIFFFWGTPGKMATF